MGRKKTINVHCCPPVPEAVAGITCPPMFPGAGCPGVVAGVTQPAAPCYVPIAGVSQGFCIDNGALLIAAAIFFCVCGGFRGNDLAGLAGGLGALKGLS